MMGASSAIWWMIYLALLQPAFQALTDSLFNADSSLRDSTVRGADRVQSYVVVPTVVFFILHLIAKEVQIPFPITLLQKNCVI